VPFGNGGWGQNDDLLINQRFQIITPNQVDMMFEHQPSVLGHIQGGAVTAVAVTTIKRSKILPSVPTLLEFGMPEFDVSAW
jgi:tripartite-type tricarboxylate transporter receptor subunit TctC